MPIIDVLPETPLAMDNDVFTFLRKRNSSIQTRVKEYFDRTVEFPSIPSITVFESFQGLYKELQKRKITRTQFLTHKQRIDELISLSKILPFDEKAAEITACIISKIGDNNGRKHWYDICIVATVLANNHGLASGNKRDMELIAKNLPDDKNLLPLAIWRP